MANMQPESARTVSLGDQITVIWLSSALFRAVDHKVLVLQKHYEFATVSQTPRTGGEAVFNRLFYSGLCAYLYDRRTMKFYEVQLLYKVCDASITSMFLSRK
jgi:hypothetical protein